MESSNARSGVKLIAGRDDDMLRASMTRDGGRSPARKRQNKAWIQRQGRHLPISRTAARWLSSVGLGLAAFALAALCQASAFDVSDTSWEGCSQLYEIARKELGEERVKAIGVLDWSEVGPSDGVLVLHPLQSMDAEETTAFMKAGGRLAIIDDYGRGEELLRRFHIERTSMPSRPIAALRNNPQLAIAEPSLTGDKGQATGPHPVVTNVQQFVTNHATGLRHPNLSPVLEVRAVGEAPAIVAVAGQVGKGRLFALSDPSGLMNQMLRYPGNRAFASGLCRYLVDEDGGERRAGKLFVVANRFDEIGAFGGKTTLRKDIENQARAISDALADARQNGLPTWVHWLFAFLAVAGVGAWVARASGRPYKTPQPRFARPTALVAQGGVAGRFALLAAPSSPPTLILLELKSALTEALTHKLNDTLDPSPEALVAALSRAGVLDEKTRSALKEVLVLMQRAEASVVSGRPISISRATLRNAAAVVQKVLRASGAIHAAPLGETSTPNVPKHLSSSAKVQESVT